MSFAQRFAAQRSGAEQQEPARRMSPMGGGGGGPSEAVFESAHGWTEVSPKNPFSRPERRQAPGPSYADYKKKKEEPKPLRMDDDEAFPSLGGAPKAKPAAAGAAGSFAGLAASWAAKDEATATEERRRQQEDDDARLKREREQRSTFVPRIFRSGVATVHNTEDSYLGRPYSPHSPTYDPDYYGDELSAEPYDEPIGRNAMLDDSNEDNEGWMQRDH
jgi:hypothetical protein